jgi:hypothetical protein
MYIRNKRKMYVRKITRVIYWTILAAGHVVAWGVMVRALVYIQAIKEMVGW